MDHKILIIQNSAIVREGLSSIIHKFTVGKNIRMEVTNDLEASQFESSGNLLVFSDTAGIRMFHGYLPVGVKVHLKMVGVVEGSAKSTDCELFDEIITLDDPVTHIYRIVSRFFDLTEAQTVRSEGTELTLREQEVLKLVSTGFSNKEIADTLFISTHTVISHRKNITEKLGIKSISGLTIYAMLNKIIDADKMDFQSLI